jgi:hypothetical protein
MHVGIGLPNETLHLTNAPVTGLAVETTKTRWALRRARPAPGTFAGELHVRHSREEDGGTE